MRVELQRDEHDEDAEQERGERVEPEAAEEAPVAERAAERAGNLRLRRARQGAIRPTPASATAATPTAVNVGRMPAASATAPNIGPRIAPKTAAPKAVPISSPRRSRGVATVSQASAPAHVTVLETPWTNRASPSVQGPPAKAKPKLASASSPRPSTTARFGPYRRCGQPAGDAAEQRSGAERADEQSDAGPSRARTRSA